MDEKQAVIVTTKHRGVFFGYIDPAKLTSTTVALSDARMAIRWGTTQGVQQLAATGPTADSKVGAKCDIPVLHDVTAVFAVSSEAQAKWDAC